MWLVSVIIAIIASVFLLTGDQTYSGGRREINVSDSRIGSTEYIDDISGEVLKYNNKEYAYKPPSSNQQIRAIMKFGDIHEKARLYRLICKQDPHPANFTRMCQMLDSETYELINKRKSHGSNDKTDRSKSQASEMYRRYRGLYKSNKVVEKYLDIGCGDGLITEYFGKSIGAKSITGLDIQKGTANIEFAVVDPLTPSKLPFANNSMDVISSFMGMHHVIDLTGMASEITRVLRSDGLFVIKEHDCWNAVDAMLVDVEHGIFLYEEGITKEYGHAVHYKNYHGWDKTFTGLKYVEGDFYYTNPRNEISPTRAFMTVYKKD
jgi:ubiquinone/menaquinone biosynthesis C-methylase UbiE